MQTAYLSLNLEDKVRAQWEMIWLSSGLNILLLTWLNKPTMAEIPVLPSPLSEVSAAPKKAKPSHLRKVPTYWRDFLGPFQPSTGGE